VIAETLERLPYSKKLSKEERRAVVASSKSFTPRGGFLYKREANVAIPLRRVVCLPTYRTMIIDSCHGGSVGGHRGVEATISNRHSPSPNAEAHIR